MYIPLFNKSNYTLLSSLLKVDDIINYAKKSNISQIAITDTNMYATMEFIKKCEKENIKPIIGLHILLEESSICLYAKDYDGYKSLIKLSTIQTERTITKEDLILFKNQVIGILPFQFRYLYNDYKEIYSDLYLGYTTKKECLEARFITPNVVFFRESLYLTKNDEYLLPYLYRIRDGKTISDDYVYDTANHELELGNIMDLSDNDGLLNTIKIADSCNLEFPPAKLLLPVYDCSDPSKYLFELCKVGLTKRLNGTIPENYKTRLTYELEIINEMGFPNYFLVVYDFIKYAKKNKILVGPGRGSAAGSLVAYSLGITDIDPLEYNLIFERFLNPERKTMPDIDTDFPDNRRGEVINYVIEKYGKRKVCGIITFGTLAAKQALRDVGRVLNVPQYKIDGLCKFIPTLSKEKLTDIYHKNQAFKARVDSDTILSDTYKIASILEGYPRHTSSHAAGIVMCQVDLDEVIPLTLSDGMYLTGYTMDYLEELGLLKMDFLGIKNLSLIDNVLTDIKEQTGEVVDFNKIPLDDKETLKLFETANTCGIFQFESTGMKNFIRRLKPTSLEDIYAAIALFRPGAAVNIDSYIRRKHGEEPITYLDPCLEPILKDTYGTIIYQEQIINAANTFAGYTLGEADVLRRAMSKKKLDLLQAEEEKFIKKSLEKGHSLEQAKKMYELILNFAGFGFNRSHSVAYAIIAYKMAYLKTHYKTFFFAALLTNVIGSEAKTHEYIMEAKANKIEVEKPTINKSSDRYIVENNKIIYPISNIKSIGAVISDTIKKARTSGEFIDIYDCFSRLYIEGLGKKNFETLIMADVFKDFRINRKTLYHNLDSLFNYAELTKDIDPSLVAKPDIEIQEEFEQAYLLEKEKEVFGFYLSSHPTTMYMKENPYCIPLNTVDKYFGKKVDTLILVDKIKVINTKKGDKMAFITGSDETTTIEYTLFPKTFDMYQTLERGDLLKIRGNVERRLDQLQIIVEKIKFLNKGEGQDER